jgi:DNA-binding NtrC family response regulator
VRETFRTLLSPGYDVVVTPGAEEATQLNAIAEPAEILIVDIPKSSVPDLAWLNDWTGRWPATAVVLSIGFLSDELRALLPLLGPVQLLIKPFARTDLRRVIERAPTPV